jgi:hypothetical protein
MGLRLPAITFLVLGIVFLVFSRRVAAAFAWLDKAVRDDEARKRFPHLAPLSGSPRPAGVLLMGAGWIACAIILWFISQR